MWEIVSLADVCERPQYGAIASGSDKAAGPFFVRQTDIVSGRINWDSVPRCDLAAAQIPKYTLSQGDLLISRLGNGVGNTATVRDTHDAVFAGYLVRFRADTAVAVPEFLGYQLQSVAWHQHVASFRSGAAQPTLNAQQMGRFTFPLPPLPEQHAIAATLGALDDKIDSNRRVVTLALDLIDALAAQCAESLPTTTLKSLAQPSHETVNPTTLSDQIVDHFSLPAFDDGPAPEIVPSFSIMSNKQLIARRSILVSRLNPRFNRTWWVSPRAGVPALASTEFLCLTAPDDLTLARIWLAVRDDYFRTELTRRVTGTSGSHQRIRPDDALSIEVPNTSLAETATVRQALTLLDLIEFKRSEAQALTSLRDALLPELLSGRTQISNADAIRGQTHDGR